MAPIAKRQYRIRRSNKKRRPEAFPCLVCGDEFSSYYYMKQHEAKVHLGIEVSKKKKFQSGLVQKTYVDITEFIKHGILVQRIKTAAFKTFVEKWKIEGRFPYVFLYYNNPEEKPILCRVEEFCEQYSVIKPANQNEVSADMVSEIFLVAKIKEYWDESDKVAKYHILSPHYDIRNWKRDLARARMEVMSIREAYLQNYRENNGNLDSSILLKMKQNSSALLNIKQSQSSALLTMDHIQKTALLNIKQSDSSAVINLKQSQPFVQTPEKEQEIYLSQYRIQEPSFMDNKYSFLHNGRSFLDSPVERVITVKEADLQREFKLPDPDLLRTPVRGKKRLQESFKRSFALINSQPKQTDPGYEVDSDEFTELQISTAAE